MQMLALLPHGKVVYLSWFAAAAGSQAEFSRDSLHFFKCRYPIDPFGCICLFQRLSHARLSTYSRKVKPRMAH